MSFCLPKIETEKFLTALKDGKIVPEKLIEMTSAERRDYFKKIIGDDAREVNALFESKLLLKDQKKGLVTWANKISGLTEVRRNDIIAKIEKMDKVLNPADERAFLEDLAAQKLGTNVTFDEAKQISKLSKNLTESKAKLKSSDPIGSDSRIDYGSKKVALQNYVSDLKVANEKTTIKGTVEDLKKSPLSTVAKTASDIAGIAKGIKASLDNSAIFRQGWRTIFTNPSIWAKNALDSFSNIYKQLKLKPTDNAIIDGIKADIYSRPNALDGTYQKMKLDIGTGEEAYPTSLPERIPLFGRLYKASETAYTGFLYRMRADIADKVLDIAKKNGVDLTNELQVRSIGKLVNSLTGRGSLGALEKIGKHVNTVFFSPKSLKASFDFLTLHAGDTVSSFARKQAAINLLKVASGMAVILGVAKALNDKSVELDPRSSDFGKIKIKDTRFDVSGGMSSLVVLASRLLSMSSKSSTTGKVSALNSGKFGSQTGVDVFVNFLENKLSPATAVVRDIMKGQDFNGKKPTVASTARNLFVPLPITNIQDLMKDKNSANLFIAALADALGISTNTYSSKKK